MKMGPKRGMDEPIDFYLDPVLKVKVSILKKKIHIR